MTMRLRVREMEQELGTAFSRVIVSGGGSNAPVMMQVFADCWGVEAVRMKVNNAAGLHATLKRTHSQFG